MSFSWEADLPLNYPGAPFSRSELATTLAQKYGLPSDQPWPETAQAYLAQKTGDRHGLISFLDAFYIGKYSVTNTEYKRYMEDLSRTFDFPRSKADHPVVQIS